MHTHLNLMALYSSTLVTNFKVVLSQNYVNQPS